MHTGEEAIPFDGVDTIKYHGIAKKKMNKMMHMMA